MSHHQDPFAEPQEPLDSNPFDPPNSASSSNPFNHPNDSGYSLDSQDTERGLGGSRSGSQAQNQNTFGYGQNQSQSSGSIGRDDVEAERKRLALDRKNFEEERRRFEDDQRRAQGNYANNWPPFLPFVHHDISTLPPHHQAVTKMLYFQWLALVVTLIVNLLGCIFLLIAGSSEGGADVAAAGGYVPVIGIASFIVWYRPIYLGFSRTEGKAMAFFFYLYFLFAGFHLLFSMYMVIGIPSTGSAGLINTISMLSQGHILAGVFGVFSSLGWVIQSAGGGLLYKRVWDYKNGNGDITFAEATNQFKSNSIKTIILHQARI